MKRTLVATIAALSLLMATTPSRAQQGGEDQGQDGGSAAGAAFVGGVMGGLLGAAVLGHRHGPAPLLKQVVKDPVAGAMGGKKKGPGLGPGGKHKMPGM